MWLVSPPLFLIILFLYHYTFFYLIIKLILPFIVSLISHFIELFIYFVDFIKLAILLIQHLKWQISFSEHNFMYFQ